MSDDIQNDPVQPGARQAGFEVKVRGIVTQIEADLQQHPDENVEVLLRRRLDDAGIAVSDEEFDELLIAVKRGDPTEDLAPGADLEESE